MPVVVWVDVPVGGLSSVVVKYFIIIYSGSIVGFLVGNALVCTVIDCTVDSVLNLSFLSVISIHNSPLFIYNFSFSTFSICFYFFTQYHYLIFISNPVLCCQPSVIFLGLYFSFIPTGLCFTCNWNQTDNFNFINIVIFVIVVIYLIQL